MKITLTLLGVAPRTMLDVGAMLIRLHRETGRPGPGELATQLGDMSDALEQAGVDCRVFRAAERNLRMHGRVGRPEESVL